MTEQVDTREIWLNNLIDEFRAPFTQRQRDLPDRIWISVGEPPTRERTHIGRCYYGPQSQDGNCHIFIAASLIDPIRVSGTVAHELTHVVTPSAGHGKEFRRLATSLGLEGPMRATTEGPGFVRLVTPILDRLGPYPHAQLTTSSKKRDGTRMLKCQCALCGYSARPRGYGSTSTGRRSAPIPIARKRRC